MPHCTNEQEAIYFKQMVDFNNKFKVGDKVTYYSIRNVSSTAKEVTIKDEAFLSCAGYPVVFVNEVSGYVCLENIER